MQLDRAIEQAATWIEEADALIILAGAGMGVDSGLPDFRGPEGFWRAYPQFKSLGLRFEELADPYWFGADPARAWGFYGHRFNLYRSTEPHSGFLQLLRWGRSKPGGVFVFTSNVDGHFQRAGFEDQELLECHGAINTWQCVSQCNDELWPALNESLKINAETLRALAPLPSCPNCGGLARPNILMFGDGSWNARRARAQEQQLQKWLNERLLDRSCIALIEFGAGCAVPTVRAQSEFWSQQLDAPLIRVNPRDTSLPRDGRAVSLPCGALEAINQLSEKIDSNI